MMIEELSPPQEPPDLGCLLLCGRCETWWVVVSISNLGQAMQVGPVPHARYDAPKLDYAWAEMPFCPSCGTVHERERGARFKRPVLSREALRERIAELGQIYQRQCLQGADGPSTDTDTARVKAILEETTL